MPSAAAKKNRADQRARVHVPKDASSLRSGQQLDDDIATFNYMQQQLNAEREDLMKRMTQQNVSSSMPWRQQTNTFSPPKRASEM